MSMNQDQYDVINVGSGFGFFDMYYGKKHPTFDFAKAKRDLEKVFAANNLEMIAGCG